MSKHQALLKFAAKLKRQPLGKAMSSNDMQQLANLLVGVLEDRIPVENAHVVNRDVTVKKVLNLLTKITFEA